jgi:ATP-dependent Clp protease adaptor protein ClpS
MVAAGAFFPQRPGRGGYLTGLSSLQGRFIFDSPQTAIRSGISQDGIVSMSARTASGSRPDSHTVVDIREPRRYRVLLHNDDYTTMEFVVEVLVTIFHKNLEEATAIMLAVHERGLAVCGVYTEEIAETRISQVHEKARKAGFPLRCSMEEE